VNAVQVDRFCHEALLYAGQEEFLKGVVPFLRQGLAADEAIMVVAASESIAALQEALGEQAEQVHFADMADIGRNPARILPHWQNFVDEHVGVGRRARGVGEPIWPGRTSDEVIECQVHERLLNVAFARGGPWRLLCPYDVESLAPEVVQEARRSHPMVTTSGLRETSPPFLPSQHSMAELDRALPEPTGPVARLGYEHGLDTLASVRKFVADEAQRLGLAEEGVKCLVLATNELVTNSLRHGPGEGTVRLWREDGAMVCEVRDRGHFSPAPLVGRQRPNIEQVGGRGLWLANQLCDLVQIRAEEEGTVVRLHML